MKILQVTSVFPPHIGGLENVVYNISKGLIEEGHQVTVYTTNLPRSKAHELKNGITINRIPVLFAVFGAPIAIFLPYMMKENVDLVHVHVPPVLGATSALVFSRIKRIPVVLTFHNDTVGKNFVQRLLAGVYNVFLNRLILENVKLITVPSQAYEVELKRRGIDDNKIKVINNGIDFSIMHANSNSNRLKAQLGFSGKKMILFVGALEKRKGVEFLIKALPIIKEKVQDAKLLIVGNGSEKNHLEELANSLDSPEGVIFTGHVSDERLEALYNAADVFVLPSLYESFGLVLLEAMAHRKPIVATKILGVSELVTSGLNGILVEPRNSEQLSEAIIQVLSEKNYANQLGTNGELFSRKFGWKKMVAEYMSAYRECLN
jgi:glycosyltransferase involved in cell wall biosynthesis